MELWILALAGTGAAVAGAQLHAAVPYHSCRTSLKEEKNHQNLLHHFPASAGATGLHAVHSLGFCLDESY